MNSRIFFRNKDCCHVDWSIINQYCKVNELLSLFFVESLITFERSDIYSNLISVPVITLRILKMILRKYSTKKKTSIIVLFLGIIVVTLTILLLSYNQKQSMKKLEIGDKLPVFSLQDQFGQAFDIKSVLGKKNLVLFFYPKDDTPGCTKEACSFRDQFEAFKEVNAEVIGISGQSVESHKKFAEKHRLTYILLTDTENMLRKQFGVPTNLFGLLPGRVTYVINKNGEIIHIFNSQTQAEKHVDEALRILKMLK